MAKPTSAPISQHPHQREETVLSLHPSWKGMIGWYTKSTLIAIGAIAVAYLLETTGTLAVYWLVLVVLIAIASVVGIGHFIRYTTIYVITNRRVSETRGILNKRTESAFFTEITNTTVERSLSERMLGIGRLDFDTAGERLIARELDRHNRTTNNAFLSWWGLPNPYQVEAVVDGLRFGDDAADDAAEPTK
jgi:uncharacterized membrane protein YdbT with pleckstrin-like domain